MVSAEPVTCEADVPDGWQASALRQLVSVKYGKGLPERTRVAGSVPVYGSNGRVGTHVQALSSGPTVIVGRKGTVGAVHFSSEPCWPIDTTYFIDVFPGLDPRYLTHALAGLDLARLDTSTAVPGLNRDDLYDQVITVPSLSEQQRIVAKIEELLAQVNAVREHLARVPAILKRFRQSVLAAACSGRLTEDWRSRTPKDSAAGGQLTFFLKVRAQQIGQADGARRRRPVGADPDQIHDLPQEWEIASLDQLTFLVTSGSRGWAKFYSESGPFFIRAQDINTDRLNLEKVAHVQLRHRAEGGRTRIARGDLLVTVTGANVTRSAIVNIDLAEAYVSQHVALVRPVDSALSPFLLLWILSPAHGRAKLLADAYGAGKPGLNLDNIREMTVALPPLDERHEIVRRVDALFALADAIEQRVATATARADRLTQSILAKAFRGELVPTDAEVPRHEGCACESVPVPAPQPASSRARPRTGYNQRRR